MIAIFLFLSSCTTSKQFESHINANNCDEALREAPQNKNDFRLVSETQYAAGSILSYSVTGAAYTADVVIYMSTTALIGIAVCFPAIIVDNSLGGAGKITNECYSDVTKDLEFSHYGRTTYEATKPLRCPRVDTLSQAVRKVASCYVKKGGAENSNKALRSLYSVYKSKEFYRCLTPSEREAYERDLQFVEALQPQKTNGL